MAGVGGGVALLGAGPRHAVGPAMVGVGRGLEGWLVARGVLGGRG